MKCTAMKFTLVSLLFLASRFELAGKLMQLPESPDGEEDPYPGAAPIDDHLMILIIAGLLLGFYFLIKKKRFQASSF